MQILRLETLLRLLGDRKTLVSQIIQSVQNARLNHNQLHSILEYQNTEINKISTKNMISMTDDMNDIARKTKIETVSMKVITVVTMFFLPGTFISVCQPFLYSNFSCLGSPFTSKWVSTWNPSVHGRSTFKGAGSWWLTIVPREIDTHEYRHFPIRSYHTSGARSLCPSHPAPALLGSKSPPYFHNRPHLGGPPLAGETQREAQSTSPPAWVITDGIKGIEGKNFWWKGLEAWIRIIG